MSQFIQTESDEREGADAAPDDPPRLRVTGLAAGGDGVGRLSDGRVVFVEGGVPGDWIELADYSVHKKLARARVGRLIDPNPDRVQPRCPHFGSCGGCRWQHVRYEVQLAAKRTIVRDALERIGGLDLDLEIEMIASPDSYGYRARARLAESQEGELGYRIRGSHVIHGVDECPILVPAARDALVELVGSVANANRSPIPEEPNKTRGNRRATVSWIVSAGTSGPAVVRRADRRRRHGASRQPGGKGDADQTSGSVTLEVLGERLRASSGSFIQGNALLWDALADAACSQCVVRSGESTPEHFIELYAGVGFLTIPLARRGLSGVAIESDRSALSDLRANLSSSGLAKQVEVIRGRVESRGDLANLFAAADVLLMDPPRIGLHARVRDAIVAAGPARLVYVACDPATLARDLRIFRGAGYLLKSVRVLDLFPQTPHVEVVATLERLAGCGKT